MHCENGVVIFDENTLDEFNDMFPEFKGSVTKGVLKRNFIWATLFIANDKCSMVQPCSKRMDLYWLIMAHYAFSMARGAGVVGQVSSASQGSVSLGMSAIKAEDGAEPWLTSQYGIVFWNSFKRFGHGPIVISTAPRRPSLWYRYPRRH